MKKPARAKAAPAKPSPKAAQPGNRPGRGKAAHAKKAPAKPAHVPAKVKAARHAAAVKASKTRAANAKKAKAHPRRQLALGSAVACCSAEALAASLRLTGWPVTDADVLALYWHTARDEHAGASILATLEAAAEYGLAGVRPLEFGPVLSDDFDGEPPRLGVGNVAADIHVPQIVIPAGEDCADQLFRGHGASVILGLSLPGPHAVLDTGSEWMSWGQAWPVSAFPDVALEEAWEVTWPDTRRASPSGSPPR
jgi:hypothetical protein